MSEPETREFLSADDRAYLEGRKEYEGETSEANTRRRIRERGRQAYSTFSLLLNRLEPADRRELFFGKDGGLDLEPELHEAVRDTLAFTLQGLNLKQLFFHVDDPGHNVNALLREAVEEVGHREGFHVEDVASLEVDATRVDVDAAAEKARVGEKLSGAEKLALERAGRAEFVLKDD